MLSGARPNINFASLPNALGLSVLRSIAITEGSSKTIPLLDTYTNVLAVPRSIPMSRERLKRLRKPT